MGNSHLYDEDEYPRSSSSRHSTPNSFYKPYSSSSYALSPTRIRKSTRDRSISPVLSDSYGEHRIRRRDSPFYNHDGHSHDDMDDYRSYGSSSQSTYNDQNDNTIVPSSLTFNGVTYYPSTSTQSSQRSALYSHAMNYQDNNQYNNSSHKFGYSVGYTQNRPSDDSYVDDVVYATAVDNQPKTICKSSAKNHDYGYNNKYLCNMNANFNNKQRFTNKRSYNNITKTSNVRPLPTETDLNNDLDVYMSNRKHPRITFN